ncbi:uncharacterized protein AMSG_10797 [Thecamonas trahens ATCC 50062]|uniref:Uncharacterized protein n=1 Tax=Thecamonas trahens ATCC 50062 TaxID=461836 RepID=A0A0L0DT23_THETB|nr:hypothetical protein AMSG_10797 [Thecamonas trahens ATCC 50062]KNC55181.1 hypothetical protein AMSG_10797 [Thecamonas trahens ATCC 50062]|eukprot:XP_013753233.1 hypothetical protein AMSG_10797 [Thecamonas trahens ATCC 50062]
MVLGSTPDGVGAPAAIVVRGADPLAKDADARMIVSVVIDDEEEDVVVLPRTLFQERTGGAIREMVVVAEADGQKTPEIEMEMAASTPELVVLNASPRAQRWLASERIGADELAKALTVQRERRRRELSAAQQAEFDEQLAEYYAHALPTLGLRAETRQQLKELRDDIDAIHARIAGRAERVAAAAAALEARLGALRKETVLSTAAFAIFSFALTVRSSDAVISLARALMASVALPVPAASTSWLMPRALSSGVAATVGMAAAGGGLVVVNHLAPSLLPWTLAAWILLVHKIECCVAALAVACAIVAVQVVARTVGHPQADASAAEWAVFRFQLFLMSVVAGACVGFAGGWGYNADSASGWWADGWKPFMSTPSVLYPSMVAMAAAWGWFLRR